MRVITVGVALAPIGILFGVLAAQENWGVFEVLLMSILGFTGSGQFTYLGFVNQGIESYGLSDRVHHHIEHQSSIYSNEFVRLKSH